MYVCMYVHIYMYVYMYICRYVYMYICIYVHMYICIYVHMYICIYVYMYICIIYLPTKLPVSLFLFFRTPCGQEEGASDRAVKRRSEHCGRAWLLFGKPT